MQRRKFILIISIFTYLYQVGICQININQFHNPSVYGKEAFNSSYFFDIKEDKRGYIWVASGAGLFRYDGKNIVEFSKINQDTIKTNFQMVTSIAIDKTGDFIWISSSNGVYYSPIDSINFKKITGLNDSINPHSFNNLIIDNDNNVWASNLYNGIFRIENKTKKVENILFHRTTKKGKAKKRIISMVTDDLNQNVLWLGTNTGLIRFDKSNQSHEYFVYDDNVTLKQNICKEINSWKDKIIIGNWNGQVTIFNTTKKKYEQTLQIHKSIHHKITNIYIEHNTLWIATPGLLCQYDLLNNVFIKRIKNSDLNGFKSGISLIDSRGIIWYHNVHHLFKFDPLESQNRNITLEVKNGIQPTTDIRSIVNYKNQYYFIGAYNSSGLFKVNANDLSFEVIKIPSLLHKGKPYHSILDCILMHDGNIMILTSDKISIYNPKTNKSWPSPLQILGKYPALQYVVMDNNNNYWISSRSRGLFMLNFEENIIQNFLEEFNTYKLENHLWLGKLYIDSYNKLWISNSWLSVMDLKNHKIYNLNPSANVFSPVGIGGFSEGRNGKIWIAGYEDGLCSINFNDYKNGVVKEVAGYTSYLYPHSTDEFWKFGGQTSIYNSLNKTNDPINIKSRLLKINGTITEGKDSCMILGRTNGFVQYNLKNQIKNTENPKPYILSIDVNGDNVYDKISYTQNLFNFKHTTKNLKLSLSALAFHSPHNIKYQYKTNNKWIDVDRSNTIYLSNLGYGVTHISLRAINGNLNSVEKFSFEIYRPWYRTYWAYLCFMLLFSTLSYLLYLFQRSKRRAIEETKQLKQLNRIKTNFYTNITHEFKTPLTIILGMSNHINDQIKEDKIEDIYTSVKLINRNGKKLLSLVNDILNLAKSESGNMVLNLVQSNIIIFINHLTENFKLHSTTKNIDFLVYNETDNLTMDFDPTLITAVVSNLLSNAIKFTPNDGEVIIHLQMESYKNEKQFIIKIKDSGIGIPTEKLNKVFSRYYQVDEPNSKKNGGTGVGLALTKEYVDLMNGSIEVESSINEGTSFVIKLPINNTSQLISPEAIFESIISPSQLK